jgi:hypothetical protein
MVDFTEIARNLLVLEVNTVLKQGMSAQRMPTPTNALVDIVLGYRRYCTCAAQAFGVPGGKLPDWAADLSDRFAWGIEPFLRSDRQLLRTTLECRNADFLANEPLGVAAGDLDTLRGIALWLVHMRQRCLMLADDQDVVPLKEAVAQNVTSPLRRKDLLPDAVRDLTRAAGALRSIDIGVLNRIRHNCDQLKGITVTMTEGAARRDKPLGEASFVRNTDLQVLSQDMVLLRKTWEIGTEVVVQQTVISIDGDVVNRINPDAMDGRQEALQPAHRMAVDASFRHWSFMIETVGTWAGTAARFLLGNGAAPAAGPADTGPKKAGD